MSDSQIAQALGVTSSPRGGFGLKAEFFTLSGVPSRLSDIDFNATPAFTGAFERLDFLPSYEAFYGGGPTDRFGARFTGDLNVAAAGRYTLYLSSDDGSALYVDGRKIIDNDLTHGTVTKTVTLDLTAGAHDIEIRYFENSGRQSLRFEWSGPDTGGVRKLVEGPALAWTVPNAAPVAVDDAVTDVIADADGSIRIDPAALLANDVDPDGDPLQISALEGAFMQDEKIVVTAPVIDGQASFTYTASDGQAVSEVAEVRLTVKAPTPPQNDARGLLGEFFALSGSLSRLSDVDFAATPVFTGAFDRLDFLPSYDAFYDGGLTDRFAARFTGDLNVAAAGRYTLYLTSDDGSALYVDGRKIIDNDLTHGTVTKTVALDLTAGAHDIEIRYFENGGRQSLQLEWSGPDTGGARKLVDGPALGFDLPAPAPEANAAPIASDDTLTDVVMGMDGSIRIDPSMLLANDTDPNGDTLTFTGFDGAVLENGQIKVTAPVADGAARFSYTVSDGRGLTDTAIVRLTTKAMDQAGGGDMNMGGGDMGNTHESGSGMNAEMAALMNLVKHTDATHFAVNDGAWSDPATWRDGKIPGDDARVVIVGGVTVDYDVVSDTRLFTVRVDGHLNFATDADTKMVVDTLVVDMKGRLTIGTEANPIHDGVSTDIIIANNGAIDVTWDPMLLSRGVISHGAVEIHGQEKTTHMKVAVDPMAGDTSLTFAEAPQSWKVGDTLVIAGTHYDGYKWDNAIRATRHYEPEDEIRTITKIDGGTVHFDAPLVNDHDAPRADLKTSVANYTRNVTIATESPETAAVNERGHVMFMHSDDVDVRYAAFHELGRTDKSIPAMDVSAFDTIAPDSNVKARYAFHFHRTGVDDIADPAIAVGNAVFGSPGWGFVHHDSNAVLHDNASYNTFGAGFVAETGNETGSWTNNIAIYAKGVGWGNPKNMVNLTTFDTANSGDGFWFQGRMVDSVGNIAASVDNGFAYFHRSPATGGAIAFDSATFDLPEALGLRDKVAPDHAPILHFTDNETFAANAGLFVVKANPNQGHDVHSVIQDFTAWSVRTGAELEYTSHYILKGLDLVGKEATPFSASSRGVVFGTNTSDMTIVDATIDGFAKAGVTLGKNFTDKAISPTVNGYTLVDVNIINTPTLFEEYDPVLDVVTTSDALPGGGVKILLDGALTYKEGWPDPTARTVALSGQKTDGLGESNLVGGTDGYDAGMQEVIRILETSGYYRALDGDNYFVLEDYYSDRLTGEIFKHGALVRIDPNVPLGNQYFAYKNAKFIGAIDLDSAAPITQGESVRGAFEADLMIDLISNDVDPDGDAIWIDGVTQPKYGRVFDNGDGTATYRPDFDFRGEDSFKYWVTDGFGNFSEAWTNVLIE